MNKTDTIGKIVKIWSHHCVTISKQKNHLQKSTNSIYQIKKPHSVFRMFGVRKCKRNIGRNFVVQSMFKTIIIPDGEWWYAGIKNEK